MKAEKYVETLVQLPQICAGTGVGDKMCVTPAMLFRSTTSQFSSNRMRFNQRRLIFPYTSFQVLSVVASAAVKSRGDAIVFGELASISVLTHEGNSKYTSESYSKHQRKVPELTWHDKKYVDGIHSFGYRGK